MQKVGEDMDVRVHLCCSGLLVHLFVKVFRRFSITNIVCQKAQAFADQIVSFAFLFNEN